MREKPRPEWSFVIYILVFGIPLHAFVNVTKSAAPHNTRKGAFRVIQGPRGQEVLYYTLDHVGFCSL